MERENEVIEVLLDDIIPNRFQPRLNFGEKELNELADSIKTYGIIQPLVLRRLGSKYEIIAGERRYKAATIAGLTKVPAIIMNVDDNSSAELAIVENLQRKDLSAIEEAQSYKKLLDKGYLTQDQLAKRMGISQPQVANKIRLLSLPDEVQNALLHNRISERHARSLLSLNNYESQINLLNRIVNEKLTVRQTEDEIAKLTGRETLPELEESNIQSEIQIDVPPMPKLDGLSNLDMLLRKEPNLKEGEEETEQIEQIVELDDKKEISIGMSPFQEKTFEEPKLESPYLNPTVTESSNPLIDEFKQQKGIYTPPQMEQLKEKSINSAIDDTRNVIKKLESDGYKVSSEEFDFEDMYQIIIKIEK